MADRFVFKDQIVLPSWRLSKSLESKNGEAVGFKKIIPAGVDRNHLFRSEMPQLNLDLQLSYLDEIYLAVKIRVVAGDISGRRRERWNRGI